MKYLCTFTFSLANGQKIRIVSRTMKQAMKTLKRVTSNRYPVMSIEIQIRVAFHQDGSFENRVPDWLKPPRKKR
jgi:hypothetical protein